jgi:hypothetical protein
MKPQLFSRLFVTLFCLQFLSITSFAKTPTDVLPLVDAVQKKLVKITAIGKGGYNGKCLAVEIKNLTNKNLSIALLAGTIFSNSNEWQQDLMVVAEQQIALKPQFTEKETLQTMCIKPHHGSPSIGVSFLLASMAEGHLLKLAQWINEKKYFSSTAQSAVWAIIDKRGMGEIYGEDLEMTKELCALVSNAIGQPCEAKNYQVRRHQITSINTSLDMLLPDSIQNAKLSVYTHNGTLFKVINNNISLPPGFFRFKLGVYHTEADTTSFVLKLEQGNKLVGRKIIHLRDSVAELQKIKTTEVNFDVPADMLARVGIYDKEDNLYILLSDNKILKKGFHRATFVDAKRELPLQKDYFLKIKIGTKTMAEQKILLNETEAKKYATLTKRGNFAFTLENDLTNGKIAVYDTENKIVWVVYETVKMGKGKKQVQYVFQHQYGADAMFVIKVTDENGNVLASQEIKGK